VDSAFAGPPDPAGPASLDGVAQGLRQLKAWGGDPSYDTITERINARWRQAGRPASEQARRATVADCFKAGRSRMNTELVVAVVRALHPDPAYATQWHQRLQVIAGEAGAASQVRVQDDLPPDLAGFTGRAAELDRLRQALMSEGAAAGAVAGCVIGGMAGVGKTRLAVRAGHLFTREGLVDRVLFVNLRGFHPGPAQPPADPGAVLDGFLRLLGVPGRQIPYDLPARTALFRTRLAGTRTLVVLDNAATAEQVRPLLPATPGCPALITSRRDLHDPARDPDPGGPDPGGPDPGGLDLGVRLTVGVFTDAEATAFLARAVTGVATGGDPRAGERIARRCGCLPLALGLVAGHIRATPGWTLTDHADRLDERHRGRHLDDGVRLALDLSYERLTAGQQRLLRLTASHPGQDFDAYAAAALIDAGLGPAGEQLRLVHGDHLIQETTAGRYTFHDLVRAYALDRAGDRDPPSARRAALSRLFDYYLATASAAADILYPAEAFHRPRVPAPATPHPALAGAAAAVAWLDAERPALVATAEYPAAHGWPAHAVRLSTTLYRYLDGGHHADAQVIHDHGYRAAVAEGDLAGQAHTLNGLATVHLRQGRLGAATEQYRQARDLFEKVDDPAGQARTVGSLGNIEKRLGRFTEALQLQRQAREFFRQAGDRAGEARSLRNLGAVEGRMGRPDLAVGHHEAALAYMQAGGDRVGQAAVRNSLGEAAVALGRPRDALTQYAEILALAGTGVIEPDQMARTHAGLGDVHRALDDPDRAREHYRRAADIYTELGMAEAEDLRARLSRK
jgi:tetratricopeptide (TPR) repeat protein